MSSLYKCSSECRQTNCSFGLIDEVNCRTCSLKACCRWEPLHQKMLPIVGLRTIRYTVEQQLISSSASLVTPGVQFKPLLKSLLCKTLSFHAEPNKSTANANLSVVKGD